jgi:gas vesicle protein
MRNGKIILGIIAGTAIGAIAGILVAPDSGSATRKKIIDHTNDLRSMLNDWATDLIASLKSDDGSSDSNIGGRTSANISM